MFRFNSWYIMSTKPIVDRMQQDRYNGLLNCITFKGYADDVRSLVLDNFTVENTTHYDFYWYAIWEDADGQQQFIERTWLNREISP